jgi:hypothetical protein
MGLPLAFIKPAGCGTTFMGTCYETEINYLKLIINIVFWYLVSCLILIKKSINRNNFLAN